MSFSAVLEFIPTTQLNLKFLVNLEHFQYNFSLKLHVMNKNLVSHS